MGNITYIFVRESPVVEDGSHNSQRNDLYLLTRDNSITIYVSVRPIVEDRAFNAERSEPGFVQRGNTRAIDEGVRLVVEDRTFNAQRSEPGFIPRGRAHYVFNWIVLGQSILSDQNPFPGIGLNENRMRILHVPRNELAISGARTCNRQFDATNGDTIVRFGTRPT